MNKSTLSKSSLAVGLLGLAAFSSSASANLSHCRFYVGAGADYNTYNFGGVESIVIQTTNEEIKSNGFGFLPLVGVKFHKHLGVEAGYSFNKKITFTVSGADVASYKVKNMYMDLMGFVPLFKNIEILGGLGVSKLNVKPEDGITAGATELDNKISWRAKVGVNYHVHQNVGIRAIATYQEVYSKIKVNNVRTGGWLNGSKFIKDLKSIGIALTYKF